MKKILLAIIISSLSISAFAEARFGIYKIKQPTEILSDWDNDGIPNSIDEDDDGDGVLDINDDVPFNFGGKNSTPNVIVNSFSPNKVSIDSGESFTLSWDIENPLSLNIYSDPNKLNLVSNVDGQTSLNLNNVIEDTTFYLDYQQGVTQTDVYVWQKNGGLSCTSYSPATSTVNSGQSFTQSRTCTQNYISNEPNSKSISSTQTRSATGVKIVADCRGDSTHYAARGNNLNGFLSENTYFFWGSNHQNPQSAVAIFSGLWVAHDNINEAITVGSYKYWAQAISVSGVANGAVKLCRAAK